MRSGAAATRPNESLILPRPGPSSVVRGTVEYLGGLGLLGLAALRCCVWTRRPAPPLLATTSRQLARILAPSLLLTILIQASLGAFLATQTFFNATFRDGAGAIVGLGMLRNLGSLVAGWVLAGVLPAVFLEELRGSHAGLDSDPMSVPDRDVAQGNRPDPRPAPEAGRLAAPRILASALAAGVLGLFGVLVGLATGMLASRSIIGVAPGLFVSKLLELVVTFDVISLAVKSTVFGLLAGLVACHEGLRPAGEEAPGSLAVYRSAAVSLVMIMWFNTTYFTLCYFSGPPSGLAVLS